MVVSQMFFQQDTISIPKKQSVSQYHFSCRFVFLVFQVLRWPEFVSQIWKLWIWGHIGEPKSHLLSPGLWKYLLTNIFKSTIDSYLPSFASMCVSADTEARHALYLFLVQWAKFYKVLPLSFTELAISTIVNDFLHYCSIAVIVPWEGSSRSRQNNIWAATLKLSRFFLNWSIHSWEFSKHHLTVYFCRVSPFNKEFYHSSGLWLSHSSDKLLEQQTWP